MVDIERQFTYKVVIVGDAQVGKTSLILKYTKGTFNKEYIITLGAQLSKFEDIVEGNKIKLVFWDIAGQTNFSQLQQSFYKGSSAAIIVFSHEENELGDKSFQNIPKWLNNIIEYCGRIPVVLFGNKIDLIDVNELIINKEHPKSDHNIVKLMKELKILGYLKTSALTGEGVTFAFKTLTNHVFQIKEKNQGS